jgi:uncharacterized protein YgiB involved in biofilm formation
MKRSKKIVLVLIASISVTACSTPEDDDPGEQRTYSTRADCLRDWKDDKYCERSTVSGGGFYYGPRYWQGGDGVYATTRNGQIERVGADVPAARGFSSSHSTGVTRGGFGGSAMGSVGE